jgi:hypothetical protein
MTEQEIRDIAKSAMREVVSARNSEDRFSALEDTVKKHGDALNEINEKLTPKKEAEGENAAFEGKETAEEEKEEKKEEEGSTVENTKPAQTLVAAFATAFNVDFGAKTPSFTTLAALAGIKETDPATRITAVNAKFEEMKKSAPVAEKTTAVNSEVF